MKKEEENNQKYHQPSFADSKRGNFKPVFLLKFSSYNINVCLYLFTIFLLISDCIPYSIEACKKAAKINGLEIGSDRFPFLGEDYAEVGCYSYKTGNSKGHVFYGTGGTDAQMRKEATGRRYRPRGYDCGGKSLTVFFNRRGRGTRWEQDVR